MKNETIFKAHIVFLLVLSVVGEFFGNFYGLYNAVPAFDIVTHFVGGALVCSVAINYLKTLLSKNIFFVSTLFTMGVGVVWEIIEFFLDLLFGLGMQGSLNDTMVDLIMVGSAAIIVNVIVYFKGK